MDRADSWARALRCSAGESEAPLDRRAGLSPAGAPWLVDYRLDPAAGAAWRRRLRGRSWSLWRYRELLPLADFERRVDLGEGGTPLVPLYRSAPPEVTVWIKDEAGNPSGSFKDRGLSLAVNRARELGAGGVQLASAGNAALALSAYAAASGLPARVALPADTPETVARRCRAYGAEVLTAPGTLLDAARRLEDGDGRFWTLATFREPYRVEGKKTMLLEVAEQLDWTLPDWLVFPTGGGTGVVAMHKAFVELEGLGLVSGPPPRIAAVQMAGCAPLVRAYEEGRKRVTPWPDPETRAWGLRVPQSLGDRLVLAALEATGGAALAVPEERIEGMRRRLAQREGRLVGPEGAAAMLGLEALADRGLVSAGQRVVVFQTGHPANYGLA